MGQATDLSSPDTSTYPARTLSDVLSAHSGDLKGQGGVAIHVDASGGVHPEEAA